MPNWSENLKKIRESKGFSQKELAEKSGIKQATLSLYENWDCGFYSWRLSAFCFPFLDRFRDYLDDRCYQAWLLEKESVEMQKMWVFL